MDPPSLKQSLPEGWVIKTSRSQKGKEYFCNPSRKISLWSVAEVFAFERGLRQLENVSTSSSKKFKPVTGTSDLQGEAPAGERANQSTLSSISNSSGLQSQEKPFRMVLKAKRKLTPVKSTLEDYIAEAAAFCSSSISASQPGTLGKQSSEPSTQRPCEEGVSGRGTCSSAGKRLMAPESSPRAKRSCSDVEKEKKNAKRSHRAQVGIAQKKSSVEVRSSQLGSSATKLWNKLFPEKKKLPDETATKKTSESPRTSENQIKDRLAAIDARIDAMSNASRPCGASGKSVPSATGAPLTPVVPSKKQLTPASCVSKGSKAATTKPISGDHVSQWSQRGVKSSGGVKQTGTKLSPTAGSPSASAKLVGVKQPPKIKTNTVVSSGPQLYDQIPAPKSSAAEENPPSLHPSWTRQNTVTLKHYTIPKRSPASISPVVPAPAAPPPSVYSSALSASPAAPTTLPSQPDSLSPALAPVAVIPPFLPPTDSHPAIPAVTSTSSAAEGRWTSGAPGDQRHQTAVATGTALASLPVEREQEDGRGGQDRHGGQEEELELMELDEPELNDEEVLSQIACIRDADDSLPGPNDWGRDSPSVSHCGSETAALLEGWGPQPVAEPVTAPVEPAAPRSLTVVLDTNVLIHGVGFVLDLRDSFIEGLRPWLLIPWVVVQELDRLKQGGRQQPGQDVTVATKARAAINFLLECLQARHPAVRGQTTAEAAAARRQLEGRVADDAILECCLAAGRRGQTLLVSDDKNLLTKVLLHGLTAVSRHQLLANTDLSGVTENLSVTEENQICFTKIILRKVLSYVIRREMSLAYGAAWHALPGVRRPWWSLRDLVSVVCGHRAVFRAVFSDRWAHWQQVLKLATRPVLSAVEQCSLCAGLASLLPHLQPAGHYLPLVRPLSAALQAGCPPPAGPLAALGPSLGGQTPSRPHPAPAPSDEDRGQTDQLSGPAEETISLAAAVRQQNHDTAQTPARAPTPQPNGRTSVEPEDRSREDSEDRTAAGTPPPEDEDAVMDSQGGPAVGMDPAEVLELFQGVWSYVNTCCGVLLDAAGVPHPYRYERPAVPPSPEECAAFLPELGVAVQTLDATLKSLMGVSVNALASDQSPLVSACDALHAVVALAGHESALAPPALLRFLRSPASRLLLGKGLEQLSGYLRTLEELHRMVS